MRTVHKNLLSRLEAHLEKKIATEKWAHFSKVWDAYEAPLVEKRKEILSSEIFKAYQKASKQEACWTNLEIKENGAWMHLKHFHGFGCFGIAVNVGFERMQYSNDLVIYEKEGSVVVFSSLPNAVTGNRIRQCLSEISGLKVQFVADKNWAYQIMDGVSSFKELQLGEPPKY